MERSPSRTSRTRRSEAPVLRFGIAAGVMVMLFQNCSNTMSFTAPVDPASLSVTPMVVPDTTTGTPSTEVPGDLGVCGGISCDLEPLTNKPAVTTVLLALGDEADDQLVVNGASAQLIAETIVRYTSPKSKPKVLLVRDRTSGSEDPEDSEYAANVLLSRYDLTRMEEPEGGLTDADVDGFDVVWLNNPGDPMGSSATRDTLIRFKGGVVLQGDDLSRGKTFSNEALTGLKYIDNGTSVKCDGVDYNHNDNTGHQFRVTLDSEKVPGADSSTIEFRYGNDIDDTVPVRDDLEILATAKGGPSSCTETRPAIVRYLKTSS